MGNNIKNTIDINGKRYDAVSGAYLCNSQRPVVRSIDGFAPAANLGAHPTKPIVKRKPHTPGIHAAAHKPEPSRTLMRTAVKKPAITAPSVIKAQTRTDILAKAPKQVITPKLSHTSVDPHRLKKAVQMSKSPSVNHYSAAHVSTAHSAASVRPAVPQRSSHAAAPVIPVSPVRRHEPAADIFEQALARATSHEQTYEGKNARRPKTRRFQRLATATLSVLLVAGIIAYFNAPALSLKMASTRAGFQAKLPSYSPVGYQFGDISYGPGNVTVSYEATDKSGKFDITQKLSDWDSQALLNNFVDTANKAYQTYERAGRTVYFFGNNTATWVDSGVWYTVNGNDSLNKSQLLDLAGSI